VSLRNDAENDDTRRSKEAGTNVNLVNPSRLAGRGSIGMADWEWVADDLQWANGRGLRSGATEQGRGREEGEVERSHCCPITAECSTAALHAILEWVDYAVLDPQSRAHARFEMLFFAPK
jgi:hypothetical protein